ncbi:MAG: c-type cytochrome, partial [Saprospiraceae bacterium]
MTRIATFFFFLFCITCCQNKTPDAPPVLSPAEALADFQLPNGFTAELVAAEPLVEAPVALAFDENADCWVVEMRSYMPDENGLGENAPTGRIKILRDTNRDGTMDQAHLFLDSLVLPRAVCPVYGGVLVAEPPALWFYERRGDKAGPRILVDSAFAEGHNPEHQANSLTPAMDNWIYAARCEKRYRRDKTGAWRIEKARFRGQWGMAQDDFGRLYYNDNSTVLTGDNLPPSAWPLTALSMNEQVGKKFGVRYGNNRVFPRRPTPGVNRGYQEGALDSTQRLVNATSACGPTIFRGDNFSVKDASGAPTPANATQFLAFVPEAAAHLVKCVVVSHTPQGISGQPDREGIDFLTATDERFRPVNAYTAPDGTLWLADFHRGLIQHATYLTPYLREHTRAKDLLHPTHLGRIFRIRKTENPPQPCASFATLSAAQLVDVLAHPNGWRRDKAQWLLVERGDTSVAPLLRGMALGHTDPRARLHALWTLDGLGAFMPGFLKTVFDNSNHPEVARLAIRLCAPHDLVVFKQLFEIAGATEAAYFAATAPAFCRQHAEGIRPVLQKLAEAHAADTLHAAVLAGALWENCSVEQVGVWRRFFAQKGVPEATVLMQYLEKTPETEAQSSDPIVAKLSVPDLELYHEGRGLYETYCTACHGKSGEGIPNLAPPLVQSGWVNAADKSIPIRIVLDGLEGPVTVAGKPYTLPGVMIGMRENMATNNGTIAKIITYIRNSWGNDAGAVQVGEVGEVRAATKDRKDPYQA